MLEFMRAGGFMMWPLLMLGVVAMVSSVRRLLHPGEGSLDPNKLASAVLSGSIAWCLLGLVTVTRAAGEIDSELLSRSMILVIGLGEALCPAVLGLAVFALVGGIASLSRSEITRSS